MKPTIVLDPGHGGSNPGAHAPRDPLDPNDDIYEKHLTLQLAMMMVPMMKEAGFYTVLTRSGDDTVPLRSRVQMANAMRADGFFSLHFNSAPVKAKGFEVLHDDKDATSALWAHDIVNAYKKSMPTMKSRGVKPDTLSYHKHLYVLEHTNMPAVISEPGFISCEEDLIYLLDNLECVARANVNATVKFFMSYAFYNEVLGEPLYDLQEI